MPNNTIISDFLTGKICFNETVKRIEDLIIKKIKEDIVEATYNAE